MSSLGAGFAAFDAAHGWAVNLFVVIALAAIGVGVSRPAAEHRSVRVGVVAGCVLCLADWVLIEDFGFFGGVGTDPNSMIPMALVFIAGYLAITRLPVRASEAQPTRRSSSRRARTWRERLRADPAYAFRSLAALGALGVTLVGAAPMAVAATEPHADPILAQAIDGTPPTRSTSAPPFTLVDQYGQPVSLASLRGKTVALTFLDPVCTSDCPVIAQEFRQADGMLGAEARRVEMVASTCQPAVHPPDYLAAFDHQEGLEGVPNWLYLTGSLPQLEHVWRSYGANVEYSPGGAMVDHSEFAYVIDATGRIRYILDTDRVPKPRRRSPRSRPRSQTRSRAPSALREPGRMSQRARRRVPRGAALALSVLSLAACGSSAPVPAAPAAPSIPTPLATSVQTSSGTWATVAMGHSNSRSTPSGSSCSPRGQRDMVEPGAGDRCGHERGPRPRHRRPRPARGSASHEHAHVLAADLHRRRRALVVDGTARPGLAARPDALAANSASQLLALVNAAGSNRCCRAPAAPPGGEHRSRERLRSPPRPADAGLWSRLDHRGRLHGGNPTGWRELQPTWRSRHLCGAWWTLAPARSGRRQLARARSHRGARAALRGDGSGVSALLGSSEGSAISLVAAWYDDGRWSSSEPLHVSPSERLSSFGGAGDSDGIFALLHVLFGTVATGCCG